jgi:hypothetical protein
MLVGIGSRTGWNGHCFNLDLQTPNTHPIFCQRQSPAIRLLATGADVVNMPHEPWFLAMGRPFLIVTRDSALQTDSMELTSGILPEHGSEQHRQSTKPGNDASHLRQKALGVVKRPALERFAIPLPVSASGRYPTLLAIFPQLSC